MSRTASLRRLGTNNGGLTLLEVVIAVSIVTSGLGFVGTAIFQTLSADQSWRADLMASKQARNANSWFAGDALNAQSTDLTDGGPPSGSVTLSWTGTDSVPHTAQYSLTGTDLVRAFDGVWTTVARTVVATGFSLSGSILTFDLEVNARQGNTESTSLQTHLRWLR